MKGCARGVRIQLLIVIISRDLSGFLILATKKHQRLPQFVDKEDSGVPERGDPRMGSW